MNYFDNCINITKYFEKTNIAIFAKMFQLGLKIKYL